MVRSWNCFRLLLVSNLVIPYLLWPCFSLRGCWNTHKHQIYRLFHRLLERKLFPVSSVAGQVIGMGSAILYISPIDSGNVFNHHTSHITINFLAFLEICANNSYTHPFSNESEDKIFIKNANLMVKKGGKTYEFCIIDLHTFITKNITLQEPPTVPCSSFNTNNYYKLSINRFGSSKLVLSIRFLLSGNVKNIDTELWCFRFHFIKIRWIDSFFHLCICFDFIFLLVCLVLSCPRKRWPSWEYLLSIELTFCKRKVRF